MKMSIKDRVTLFSSVAALAAILLLALANLNMESLRIGSPSFAAIQRGNDLNGDVQPPPLFFVEGGMHLYTAAASKSPEIREENWKEATEHAQDFQEARLRWDSLLASDPEIRTRLDEALAPIGNMIPRLESEFRPILSAGDQAAALAFLDSVYQPTHNRHDALMLAFTRFLAEHRKAQLDAASRKAHTSKLIILFSTLVFIGVNVGLIAWLRVHLHQAVINQRLVENAPVNIMMANRDLEITFANNRSKETLKSLEYAMPCKAEDIVGRNIDIFHKNPQRVRKMLENPANLPHTATIQIGDDWMQQSVAAVYDEAGKYIGPMLVWELTTADVKRKANAEHLQKEVAAKVSELQRISSGLGDVADAIGRSTREVAARTSHSSESFGRVNNAFQMVAGAAEEMSSSVSEIARHVSEAARVATEAGKNAESVNVKIGELDRSSREISKATEVVSAIAEQTNLLALNATIEAARAGEAGKGFAVVASEVKELAKQTSKATDEIHHMVETIQGEVGGSVESISKIAEVVMHIRALQDAIAAAVEQQNATARDIARSVADAARESQEIASILAQLGAVVSESTDAAANSESAAKSLLQLAGHLKSDMDSFHV